MSPRLASRARRVVPQFAIVALLLVTSGCYYEVADSTPPWVRISTTTSAKNYTTAWTNVGGTYNCTTTRTDSTTNFTLTTTCSQNQQADWYTVTTMVDRYYAWVYRHVNRASNGTPDVVCDAWYASDDIGNDGTPVYPVADSQWYVTYNWTVSEQSGMHGCGSHQAAWFAHMEYRMVIDNRRTTTTNNYGTDSRTIPVSSSVTYPKVVPA